MKIKFFLCIVSFLTSGLLIFSTVSPALATDGAAIYILAEDVHQENPDEKKPAIEGEESAPDVYEEDLNMRDDSDYYIPEDEPIFEKDEEYGEPPYVPNSEGDHESPAPEDGPDGEDK